MQLQLLNVSFSAALHIHCVVGIGHLMGRLCLECCDRTIMDHQKHMSVSVKEEFSYQLAH